MWGIAVSFTLFKLFLQFSSGVMAKELMRDFSLSAFETGLLSSAYYFVYVGLQLPAGMLADRFGTRRLLTFGGIVCAFGCYLFATSHSLWAAEIGRLLIGLGCSFPFVCMIYLISEWFSLKKYALLVGISEAVGMIGTIFANVFLAEILQKYHWRYCVWVSCYIALAIASLAWLFIRDKAREHAATDWLKQLKSNLKIIFKDKQLWINGLYVGFIFSIISVFTGLWSVPYFETALHLSTPMATKMSTLILLGYAMGCTFMGALYHKVSFKRSALAANALLASTLLAIVVFAPPSSIALLSVIMIVLGITCSAYVWNFIIVTHLVKSNLTASAIGFTNMLCVATAPLFQPLIGWLLDFSKHSEYTVADYHLALVILPLGLLVASMLGARINTDG